MTCDLIVKQLHLLAYGELSFDDDETVHQHLEACAACRREWTRVQAIHRACDADEVEPRPELLTSARRSLRLAIAADAEVRSRRAGFWSWLPSWNALAKPAGALALVAVGFLGARHVQFDSGLPLRRAEPVSTRVQSIEADASGQVRLIVDEVRRRTLSGAMQDEPIQRLLLAAARDNSAAPGVRVESVDLLKGHSAQSGEVRRALLHALQYDSNAGVRTRALNALRGAPVDEEMGRVLAHVLLNDDNPGLRTQAIDLLATRREPSMVGVLQEVMAREENNYVRMRCQTALKAMNASVESF